MISLFYSSWCKKFLVFFHSIDHSEAWLPWPSGHVTHVEVMMFVEIGFFFIPRICDLKLCRGIVVINQETLLLRKAHGKYVGNSI